MCVSCESVALSPAAEFISVRVRGGTLYRWLIGERSETPSDKLGGEISIASDALVHMSKP